MPEPTTAATVLCSHASGAGHYRREDEHCPWATVMETKRVMGTCGYCHKPRRMVAALARCGFPGNHAQVRSAEPEHDCEPPRWLERRRLAVQEGTAWTCPCGQVWRWRYYGYSDMHAWEPTHA